MIYLHKRTIYTIKKRQLHSLVVLKCLLEIILDEERTQSIPIYYIQ